MRIHSKAAHGAWYGAGLETTVEAGKALSAPGSVIYSQHPALVTLEWHERLSCLFWNILRAPACSEVFFLKEGGEKKKENYNWKENRGCLFF